MIKGNAPSKVRNYTQMRNHQTICAVKSHSRALATRDDGTGMHYGGTAPPALWKGGNEDIGAHTYQYRMEFHDLSRSIWNKFIAAIRAHLKFGMVFYNFCS